jgi:hypothetical protein
MLAENQIPRPPPWPGQDKLCLLEQTRDRGFEPVGLVGFDLMLPPALARDTSAWITDDASGHLVFCARAEHLFARIPPPLAPRRDTPLLMWLTHRALRVLCLSTPTEARLLAGRLRVLASVALGAETVEECSPGALAAVAARWIDEEPGTPALLRPEWAGKVTARAVAWRIAWSMEALSRILLLPEALVPEGTARASLLTYEDDPLVVAPLRLLIEDPRYTPQDVIRLLEEQPAVRAPLHVGPYGGLTCSAHYRQLLCLAPLLGETWRQQLTRFREELAQALGCQVAYLPPEQEQVVALLRQQRKVRDLVGMDEVYHAPFPGARRGALDAALARQLRDCLFGAVGIPPEGEDLPALLQEMLGDLPPGEN